MKTTKEQREWLRTQTNWGEHPTVRDLLDDLDEAEARAERYGKALAKTVEEYAMCLLDDLDEPAQKTSEGVSGNGASILPGAADAVSTSTPAGGSEGAGTSSPPCSSG